MNENGAQRLDRAESDALPRFCVVIPVFNGAAWLDQTLASVLLQSGQFTIRCHVQDGGSGDETLDVVRTWMKRIESGMLPLTCGGITLTFATGSDDGMYHAIVRGCEIIGIRDDDYMTWLNADDGLLPGALACMSKIFGKFPEVHWLGGRVAIADELGCLTQFFPLRGYSRIDLQAGLHDGRRLPFVMQEGTVWRATVWQRVGGLDRRLRFAGDYDLWRKFAEHYEYYTVNSLFAFHRRRRGQLSENMEAYDLEIDAVVDPKQRAVAWADRESASLAGELVGAGPLILYREQWTLGEVGELPPDDFVGTEWRAVRGFEDWEGPYPELNILHMARWTSWPLARFEYRAPATLSGTLLIQLRNVVPAQCVTLAVNGSVLYEGELALQDIRTPQHIRVPVKLERGATTFDLTIGKRTDGGDRKNLGVLIERIIVEQVNTEEDAKGLSAK